MLVNSFRRHIQQENIRERNYYFQDTILKQFRYFFINFKSTHHNLGTQIKSLYKLVSVEKGNLFLSYEIDKEEDTRFYFSLVYVFISNSANKMKKFCNLAILLSVLL